MEHNALKSIKIFKQYAVVCPIPCSQVIECTPFSISDCTRYQNLLELQEQRCLIKDKRCCKQLQPSVRQYRGQEKARWTYLKWNGRPFLCFMLCNNYKFEGSKWHYIGTWKICWTIWDPKLACLVSWVFCLFWNWYGAKLGDKLLIYACHVIRTVWNSAVSWWTQGLVMSQLKVVWQLFRNSSAFFNW